MCSSLLLLAVFFVILLEGSSSVPDNNPQNTNGLAQMPVAEKSAIAVCFFIGIFCILAVCIVGGEYLKKRMKARDVQRNQNH